MGAKIINFIRYIGVEGYSTAHAHTPPTESRFFSADFLETISLIPNFFRFFLQPFQTDNESVYFRFLEMILGFRNKKNDLPKLLNNKYLTQIRVRAPYGSRAHNP